MTFKKYRTHARANIIPKTKRMYSRLQVHPFKYHSCSISYTHTRCPDAVQMAYTDRQPSASDSSHCSRRRKIQKKFSVEGVATETSGENAKLF